MALGAGRAAELDAGFPAHRPLRRVRPGDRRLAARRRHHDRRRPRQRRGRRLRPRLPPEQRRWVCLRHGLRRRGVPPGRHTAEATALFGRYLFEQFPLRKICSEVFEFNEQAIRLNRKLGFRDAGRLRQHVWWRDRYWDLLQFELFREDFDEAMRRFSFLNSVEAEAERVIVRNGHG
jgi:hypothetical protein